MLGLLTIQTYAIKLTNHTNDELLYSCGNPANKTVILQKYELKPGSSIEIVENENYLQIYTKLAPNRLASKYPLSNQTEDLSVVTHPMLGYQFKPTAELSQPEPTKTLSKLITRPMFGTNPKNEPAKDGLTGILKSRVQSPGRRTPTRGTRNTKDTAPALDNNNSTDGLSEIASNVAPVVTDNQEAQAPKMDHQQIAAELKPVVESLGRSISLLQQRMDKKPTYRSYFTKKNIGIAVSTVGVLSLVALWLYKRQTRKNSIIF